MLHRDALFQIHHDSLVCRIAFGLLKWGWKSFGLPRYFCFHRVALLLLHHNIFDFTAMPSFVASRYFWFHRDALLLLRHNIFDFSTLPFFCRFTILSDLHEFLSLKIANTVVQRRDISSTVLKIMPSLSRPLQHGVKHIAQLYHDFMLAFQHGFNCFHEFAFDSFTLCILHKFLIVVKHFYFYSSRSGFLQWGETFELPRCSAQPALLFLFLLISFQLFTMGGNVRATTLCLRSQHIFLFVVLISLRFYRRCFMFAGRTPNFYFK